jgi:hypothetical protein
MAIQDDTQGISRVESVIERTLRQKVYPSEFFTLRLSSVVYKEERSIIEAMC